MATTSTTQLRECLTPRTQRHLLLLAYWYPPENTSGAQRPARFVKYLRAHGWESTVLTASTQPEPLPGVMEVPLQPPVRGRAGAWARALCCCERVLPYADRLPWAPLAAAEAHRIFAGRGPAVMISTSPPVTTHMAALSIKRRFGIPWVADFRDPLRDNPFRPRWWGKPYDSLIESLIFRHADAILANTDHAAEAMRRRHPRAAGRIHLLWNGYDPEEPFEAAPLPPRGYRSLVHVGSLYGGRHPGLLLASLSRLIMRDACQAEEVRVRLIGPVEPNQPWAERYLGAAQPEWLECRNLTVSRAEARREMCEADYLLLLDLNERGLGLQVPAKLFEYLRIGRPILAITARDSSAARILASSGVPYVAIFDTDTEAEIDDKVAAFFRLPSNPAVPSEWFTSRFDASAQARVLHEILTSLTA